MRKLEIAVAFDRVKSVRSILTLVASLMILLFALAMARPAYAQVAAPPENPSVDAHSVNVTTGEVIAARAGVSIGPAGHQGLSFSQQWVDDGWRYPNVPTLSRSLDLVVVSFMGATTVFESPNGNYDE